MGFFNLFIKDDLEDKGYGNSDSYKGVSSETLHNDYVISDTEIVLVGNKSIDLGGIGKGYLIDHICLFLQEKHKLTQFLINGGGDMYCTHNHGEGVEVYLQHPNNKELLVGSVLLKDKAFCSSSSYLRMWNKGGETKNHFITLDKKEVWAASFVVGDTATDVDMLATVLCVASGDEELCTDVATHYGSEYLVVPEKSAPFGNLHFTSIDN